MPEPLKELQKTLKTNGYSLTEARAVVFEALQGEEPQTMQQVVSACPSINQTSVYRAISLFEKLGIIQKLQIGWKYKIELTDAFHDHHHHLTCQRCGKIITFEEGDKLEALLQDIARHSNFEMREHQLEIQGLCALCKPQYA
jgi:Fur family ferric uptake transcriptional regulator